MSKIFSPPLAQKQCWKIGDKYLHISELGKTLVHYKMLKQPGRLSARTQSTTIVTLMKYLKTHGASLMAATA